MKNPGGQFLLSANTMANWEHHLGKSFIKQKVQVSSEDSPSQAFSAIRGKTGTPHMPIFCLLQNSLFWFWLHFSHLYCTVSIPRSTKLWVFFINYPVSHQAGHVQLQEEKIPRSQKVTVLFLFLHCGQGITRQHLPVPGYQWKYRGALLTVPPVPLVPCFPGFNLLVCSLFLLLSSSHPSLLSDWGFFPHQFLFFILFFFFWEVVGKEVFSICLGWVSACP